MKNLFLVLTMMSVLLFSTGCEEEQLPTTYQIVNHGETYYSEYDPYLNGTLYDVVVFCYLNDDIVRQDNLGDLEVGESTKIKEVPETYTKIKMSYKMLPEESAFYDILDISRSYVVGYTLLEPGKNVVLEITSQTMISSSIDRVANQKSVRMSIESAINQ